ncbi:MAG: AsmA-like C-terminal region-containing protein, partial [Cyclobacteriaceae bacterium]|nr:AsmA-like C-terminal region-containing protein [Cyclobacteriaceae bacterium]
LKGTMSQQFNGDYYLKATTQTKHINIDSLFYVFGNFKQSLITSEAIKGELDANIYAHMYFDHNWNFKRDLLYSEARIRVSDGQLINFEPIMSLSAYLNEEGENLAKLKFSNLENHIIVSNDTVFISEMYVGTNVRNIKIGGYHTLSQHIDYRLAVPVINNNKDTDEQFGKVKKDSRGHLYFPFRVYGTTSDFKVVYDFKTASSNLIKGVKKEIKGLGDVLTGKSEKKKNLQDSLKLEDDEFFDWDNN